MSKTPFIDTLKLDNWDTFKALVTDIKDLKYELKNEHRRVHSPNGAYTAYDLIKKIADPIVRVFNGRRVSDQKALDLFAMAIRKVNLLIRELADYGRRALIRTLKTLEQRLVSLLPDNTPVQLELFESERFDTGAKKPLTFKGFRKWQREARYEETRRIRERVCNNAYVAEQNKVERLRNARHSFINKGAQVIQQSIKNMWRPV